MFPVRPFHVRCLGINVCQLCYDNSIHFPRTLFNKNSGKKSKDLRIILCHTGVVLLLGWERICDTGRDVDEGGPRRESCMCRQHCSTTRRKPTLAEHWKFREFHAAPPLYLVYNATGTSRLPVTLRLFHGLPKFSGSKIILNFECSPG